MRTICASGVWQRWGHFVGALIAAVAVAAPVAHAQFIGYYALTPPAVAIFSGNDTNGYFGIWHGATTTPNVTTLSSQTLTTNGAATLNQLAFNLPNNGGYSGVWAYTFTIPAAAAGDVSFHWQGSAQDNGYYGYIVGNSFMSLGTAANQADLTFSVSAGEVFGFRIGGTNFGSTGSAYLDITNFSAPVPEPANAGLLAGCAAAGFVGLLALRRKLNSAEHPEDSV